MRHGRAQKLSSSITRGVKGTSLQLGNVLLTAFLTKTLSQSGIHKLESYGRDFIPLSDHLVLNVLRKTSLDLSKKIDFFKWCCFIHGFKHSSASYSCIFRAICKAGCLEEIPQFLDLMKKDAIPVDSATLKLLFDAFIRSSKFDCALEILDQIEKLGNCASNGNIYDSILMALIRKKQLDLSLKIFFKIVESTFCGAGENQNSIPGTLVCNEFFVALRKAGMKSEFKNVFDKLRTHPHFSLDTWGYNICIHAFGCWGDLGTSLSLFKEMKKKSSIANSWGPDLCTHNSLIHVLCLLGKTKDALIIWEELNNSCYKPDFYTYRILIQGCSKSCMIDTAIKFFNEMQYNRLFPDVIVYNSLIDGLFKARRANEACQMFEKMVRAEVRASCWTYNIIIDGLFKSGNSAAAFSLFYDLKKKGQYVDGISYSIVVLHLCKEYQLEEAIQLVEEMEARGFLVDLVTLSSLVIALHKQGLWDWTEKLMKRIRDRTLVLDMFQWKTNLEEMMSCYRSQRKDSTPMFLSDESINGFLDLLKDDEFQKEEESPGGSDISELSNQAELRNKRFKFFLSRGQRIEKSGMGSFDSAMVNTYLSVFLAKGNLSLACKLFEIFTDIGVDFSSYTFNSLITSFVKKGYFDEAWSALHEMGEDLCPVDIATYNLVIQNLGMAGRADLASSVLDMLMKQGGYLDIVMYNTLINALGKAGRIDEANKFFEQMRESGINPDVVTFNTLIDVHTKAGRVKGAYIFLRMMLDAGCSPNHVTDTILDNLWKEIEKKRCQMV